MAYKRYNLLKSNMTKLEELDRKIISLKSELSDVKSLKEYNERVIKINKLITEFNEIREVIKNEI